MASRPVKLKLLPRSTVKAKSITRIMGQLAAGDGVTITKSNGISTITFSVLSYIGSILQGWNVNLQRLSNSTMTLSGLKYWRDDGTWATPGNVTGPASSTDNAVTRYDGITGQLIQNSSIFINDSGQMGIGTSSPSSGAGLDLRSGLNLVTTNPTVQGQGPSFGADVNNSVVFSSTVNASATGPTSGVLVKGVVNSGYTSPYVNFASGLQLNAASTDAWGNLGYIDYEVQSVGGQSVGALIRGRPGDGSNTGFVAIRGFTATAENDSVPVTATIASAGAGYTTGTQTLTIVGGSVSGGSASRLVVTVAGGIVTAVNSITNDATPFTYMALPTNPVSVTGGGGAGATFNLIFGNAQAAFYAESANTVNSWYHGFWCHTAKLSGFLVGSSKSGDGAVLPTYPFAFNDGTAKQLFGVINNTTYAAVRLAGSTSGFLDLRANSVAGGSEITFPGGPATVAYQEGSFNFSGLIGYTQQVVLTEIAAPGATASRGTIWYDSTDHRFHDKNPAGVVGTTVVPGSFAAHQFLVAVSASGVFSAAQPTYSDLAAGTATNATFNTASNTFTVNGVSLDTSWTAYTPTVTASSGTFTTVSATGSYKQVGKTVFFRLNVAITTNGTAAGRVDATLPVAASVGLGTQPLSGFNDTTGAVLSAAVVSSSSTKASIFTATAGYPGANATNLVVGGVYEVP